MSDESRKGKPRVVEPQRRQGVIRFEMPEDKLAPTHTARVLWDVIGALDLTAFLDGVKAIEGTVGRKTLSPQMKLTLWLYAIAPMLAEIERRTGQLPKTLLADADHAAHDCIRAATNAGVEVSVAVPKRSQSQHALARA